MVLFVYFLLPETRGVPLEDGGAWQVRGVAGCRPGSPGSPSADAAQAAHAAPRSRRALLRASPPQHAHSPTAACWPPPLPPFAQCVFARHPIWSRVMGRKAAKEALEKEALREAAWRQAQAGAGRAAALRALARLYSRERDGAG